MLELLIISSLLGLALGSFINACAYRIPRGISIFASRSFCPSCNHRLKWYELIPVAGYVINRGGCRYCKEHISLLYPFVEITSAGIIIILLFKYNLTYEFAISSIFCLLMLLIAIIDLQHFIIPNSIIIAGFIIGFAIRAFAYYETLLYTILSSIGSMIVVAAILLLSNRISKKETMGWGDVKLAGVIGLFLGFPKFLVVLWFAAVFGTIYALTRSRKGNAHFAIDNPQSEIDFKIPFGSFLAAASCVIVYFQETISEWIQIWLTYRQ